MKRVARTFTYRGGTRISGTILACDATSGRDLTFVSSARAPVRPGRRQLLLTEGTLALLGRAGDRVRKTALVPGYGRPFSVGELRLELFPSGHTPGSASLLCELDGHRMVYTGPVGGRQERSATAGVASAEVRTARSLCLDGTFGHPRFVFPPREQLAADAIRFVKESLSARRQPVLLVPPFGRALELAGLLAAEGLTTRAHRRVIASRAAWRAAGLATAAISRFAGKLGPAEALLWPPDCREAAILGALPAPAFALLSGWAAADEVVRRLRVDAAIPLDDLTDHRGLLAYAAATGASEVAVQNGDAEDLCAVFREMGHDSYTVGPPRQMDLFRRA